MRRVRIGFKTFTFRKRVFDGHDAMVSRMSREIGTYIRDNLAFFQSFDRIVVYYDGEAYVTAEGVVTRVDGVFRTLTVVKTVIAFDDVWNVELVE